MSIPNRKLSDFWLFALALGIALWVVSVPRRALRHSSRQPASLSQAREVDLARANEKGSGREALSPLAIPWTGWKDIVFRVYGQISEDHLLTMGGGVVFYGLLAIFPAVAALVSSYGLFTKPATITQHLDFLSSVMPPSAYAIVREQVTRIAESSSGQLSFAFLAGLGVALWSANAGVKGMIDALNVVYEEPEKRGIIRLNLVSLALTIGGLITFLLAIGAVVVFPLVLNWLGLGGWSERLTNWLRWPVLLVLILGGLAALFRFGPSRRSPKWRWITFGTVFATLAWVVGSALFSWYLANFADYNATYGSLGAGIGLMMWLWLSVVVILVGAEFDSEIEHQTARDSTVGPDRPLGERGAVMADTVGASSRS